MYSCFCKDFKKNFNGKHLAYMLSFQENFGLFSDFLVVAERISKVQGIRKIVMWCSFKLVKYSLKGSRLGATSSHLSIKYDRFPNI